MDSIKELLELRKHIKSKKPDFIRQDTHKKKRLCRKWRRPKGLHSKIRLKLKGRAKKVQLGYGSPKKVRNLHKSGFQQYVIKSIKDLEVLDSKKTGLVISSSLGNKKRIVILKKAKEKGFRVLNFSNPDEFIKKVEEKITLRKNKKKGEQKKTEEAKRKEEKKLIEKAGVGNKKEAEKKEKDKLLTKKDK